MLFADFERVGDGGQVVGAVPAQQLLAEPLQLLQHRGIQNDPQGGQQVGKGGAATASAAQQHGENGDGRRGHAGDAAGLAEGARPDLLQLLAHLGGEAPTTAA